MTPINNNKGFETLRREIGLLRRKSLGSYKLPRSYIIRALNSDIMRLDVNFGGVKTKKEL